MKRRPAILLLSLLGVLCVTGSGCVSLPPSPQLLGSDAPAAAPACVEREAGSGALDPAGFSVASWNIFKQKRLGWLQEAERLRQESDLLLLQEAGLEPGLEGWLEEQRLSWDMSRAFRHRGVSFGVMTLGAVPADAACGQLRAEPWLRIPKAALASTYAIAGRDERLLVLNFHAVNFSLGTAALAEQLAGVGSALSAHPGPVVMAGDFNTWSRARFETLADFTARHGLQRVAFDGAQPSRHLGRVVDHVFYRGLRPLGRAAVPVDSSDHHPLQVRFGLAESGD